MENQNKQIQKINPQMLEQAGCNQCSIKLMSSLLKKDRVELNIIKQELVPSGNPNYEVLLGSDTIQMSSLRKMIGDANLAKLIIILIEDLVNFFNVERPMNEDQITDLAVDLMNEMRYHRFEEIVAFFEGIKKGKYGKVYERFDAYLIWEMFIGREGEENEHSYEFKKMRWCEFQATKDNNKDPIIKSEIVSDVDKLYSVSDSINQLKNRIGEIRNNEKK